MCRALVSGALWPQAFGHRPCCFHRAGEGTEGLGSHRAVGWDSSDPNLPCRVWGQSGLRNGDGVCWRLMSPSSCVLPDPSSTYIRQLESKVRLLEGDKLLAQVGRLRVALP